ncbi:MAG: DNA alkylation repair protein [Denitrovibrio sp.]|nr:MAG: DNA alkylation repair protein [Denitrovibrio sp.]
MAELLREVFSTPNIEKLAARVKNSYKPFDCEAFLADAVKNQKENNYGLRLEQITDSLYKHLPSDYETTLPILIKSLTDELEVTEDFKFRNVHFINLAQGRYISKYGLEHFELSMNGLKEMTKTFTAEYDIRYFLERYPSKALNMLKQWADSENVHVRRLASEGTRPRLPMGRRNQQFVKDPEPIIPILEKLKNDPALYVRRSVANSLNDISKDHPDMAADIAERWINEGFENSEWVCRHAMRSLFKSGHKKALSISGFPEPEGINVWGLNIKYTTLKLGDKLEFTFVMDNTSEKELNIMVDFEILFVKSNKKLSPKVFKLKKTVIKPGEVINLSGRHPLRESTTRKHYTGRHLLRVMVNGRRSAPAAFYLQA